MNILRTFVIGFCLLSQSALLQALELEQSFYIAPSLSYQDFGGNILDDGFGLESNPGVGLAGGYRIDKNWGFEFAYHLTGTETSAGAIDVDSEYFHVDGLYHLYDSNNNQWSYYYVAGMGIQNYDANNYSESDTVINAGAGIEYRLQPNLYFRSDLRGTVGLADTDGGGLFNLGIAYFFTEKRQTAQTTSEGITRVRSNNNTRLDSDDDGVPDSKDQCPGTAVEAKVDGKGCYLTLREDKAFNLDVKFKSGSSDIADTSTSDISQLAEFLTAYPETQVVIEGHSDSVGSAAGNKVLSQKRAESVKQYLQDNFNINGQRISAIGYGEEKPIADNASPEGRAANRRVVATVRN